MQYTRALAGSALPFSPLSSPTKVSPGSITPNTNPKLLLYTKGKQMPRSSITQVKAETLLVRTLAGSLSCLCIYRAYRLIGFNVAEWNSYAKAGLNSSLQGGAFFYILGVALMGVAIFGARLVSKQPETN